MTQKEVSPKNSRYDARHDVLHVFFGNLANSSADEDYPGVYVGRDDDTNEVVKLTIMDFQKRHDKILRWLPQYKFTGSFG